ncbi:hypothetical protein BJY04DRAFT_190812 [Aspergillus karnatakaensis]|uniref:uncharacterized protein n=1 Tax=Aspergillus karnatakaensis TaxID=1810916 RepID=UPI003CCDE4E9
MKCNKSESRTEIAIYHVFFFCLPFACVVSRESRSHLIHPRHSLLIFRLISWISLS